MENNNDDVEVVPAKNDDVEVVPAKKKVVKWQKSKGSHDTDEGTRSYESSSSVLGKFLGFVFSPLGVAMIIFVSFNYPWLKQQCVVGVSSLTSRILPTPINTSTPSNPTTTTTTGIPKSVPVLNQPREVNKMAQKASSPSSSTPPELASPQSSSSSACAQTNPLMKILDRDCRDEMRAVRREKRLESFQQQRELRERRSRSKAAAAQQKQTYANADTTRVNNKKKDTKDASPFDGDLECNNIISRQCRQKKRLLAQQQQQQLKEAEKK